VGKFAANDAQLTCNNCPLNYISATTGAVACTPCPFGFITSAVGSAACVACPEGQTTFTRGGPCEDADDAPVQVSDGDPDLAVDGTGSVYMSMGMILAILLVFTLGLSIVYLKSKK